MYSRFLVFTATSVVLIAVLALGTTRSVPNSTGPNYQSKMLNRTRSLEVLRTDRDTANVSLILKNNYGQSITAFVVSIGKEYQVQEEFVFAETFGEVGIQPSKTYQKSIPLPESLQMEPELPIVIEAVILADGVGDGSPLVYEHMVEERVGRAVQIRRSLRLLNQYLRSNSSSVAINDLTSGITTALGAPEAKTLSDIQEFRPLGSINSRSGSLISDHLNRGLKNGQEDVLRQIAEAKASQSPRERLLRMKMLYEKFIARL